MCLRGTISLVGPAVDAQGMLRCAELENNCSPQEFSTAKKTREQRDGEHYHITLLTKNEQAKARESLEVDGERSRLSVYDFVKEFMFSMLRRGEWSSSIAISTWNIFRLLLDHTKY